jgi:hypothetical protein
VTSIRKKPERPPSQVPPLWAGGSRTTAERERIREQARRRAKIARIMLARRAP